MQIQAINNFSNTKIQKPQFKSAYPVYHWVEKADKKYVVAVTKSEVEKIQSKLIRMLNKTLSRKECFIKFCEEHVWQLQKCIHFIKQILPHC